MHPFDLATNKVLAMVGRLEVRDWVDAINADRRLQPLGHLLWAAAAKTRGTAPARCSRMRGAPPTIRRSKWRNSNSTAWRRNAVELASAWHGMLAQAASIIDLLPPEEAGNCVLDAQHNLFTGSSAHLSRALAQGEIRFHTGSLGGAYPRLVT